MFVGKKVLIIDDEIELCQLLKSYFQKKQYEVHLSHTLEEGMQAFDSFQPDIVFLDNNLPDGSGWNLGPVIAAKHPESFVILISGYYPNLPVMPGDARYAVMEKPVSFSDIEKKIQHITSIK